VKQSPGSVIEIELKHVGDEIYFHRFFFVHRVLAFMGF
jgi:hypothetical protein